MKTIKFYCLIIITLFLLSSCVIVGLTDGYSSLSPSLKEKIGYSSKGDTTNKRIVMLNGKELRYKFDPNKTNVVFIYNPYCTGENCVVPYYVSKRLPKNAKLYIVPTVLMPRVFKDAEDFETYGMDKYYYGEKYIYKYIDKFLGDLTGPTYNPESEYMDLFVFKGKDLIKTANNIDSLKIE